MSKAQDPFATTSDPNLYVPRPATERALDALADATWHQGGMAALLGPPGVGKSLLLRVLARRAEEELHCIHVPVPTLDPEGITLWVASRLPGGRRLGGSQTLLEVARERPLLLLVEDAELLPSDSARAIAELHRASSGAIRAVLAVNAEQLPENLSASLEPECVTVTLDEPMDHDEAVAYVTQRLAAAGVPQSVAERFDAGTVAKLLEGSAGNPARFNTAARAHMPVASRALAPRPPEAGLWQDPFPLEPAAVHEAPPPRDRARRRWVWGLSWALGASAATFAAGLLLGLWLRGTGPSAERGVAQLGTQGSPNANFEGPSVATSAAQPDDWLEEAPRDATRGAAVAAAPEAGARRSDGSVSASRVARPPVAEAPLAADPPVAAKTTSRSQLNLPSAAGDAANPESSSRPATRSTAPVAVAAGTSRPLAPLSEGSPTPGAPVGSVGTPSAPPVRTPERPVAALAPEGTASNSAGETAVAALSRVDARDPAAVDRADEARAASRELAPSAPAPERDRLFAPELPFELSARIEITAEPRAFVEIDGKPFGPTPIRIEGLRPGPHRLVAHFQTGETMMRELVLSSGERNVTLRGPVRKPPQPLQTLSPPVPIDPAERPRPPEAGGSPPNP